MTGSGTCASSTCYATDSIQGAVYVCGTEISCDHLREAQESKAVYAQYLREDACRPLNRNFEEFSSYEVQCITVVPLRNALGDNTPTPRTAPTAPRSAHEHQGRDRQHPHQSKDTP
jgi:hypothetical protein